MDSQSRGASIMAQKENPYALTPGIVASEQEGYGLSSGQVPAVDLVLKVEQGGHIKAQQG